MKKKLGLAGGLLVLLFVLGAMLFDKSRITQFIVENDEKFYISLKLDGRTQEVLPWYDEAENLYYFFLPSCVYDKVVFFDSKPGCRMVLNGKEISKRDSFFWEKGEVYLMELGDNCLQVTFMKSENLPSLFMDTESGSMDALWKDKQYKESGTLTIVSENGNIQYSGKLDKISGRGNTTWAFPDKKPYSISLTDSYPLCNMSAGKDWDLLSLCFEHDKIHTKIIFDMAREIGLSATPECTWVDLYCEGEYLGLYLLTEDVAADYKNISDGVLLEREKANRLTVDESFIETDECHYVFVYRRLSDRTEAQMLETADFVQNLEDLILEGYGSYKERIDMDSIAKQYLIDEIFMERDAMGASTYFYIDLDKDIIYAGPLWDYDRSVGLILPDYNTPIDGEPDAMSVWYDTFYNDPEFYSIMNEVYVGLQSDFERIINEDIDSYVDWIRASVEMDSILFAHVNDAKKMNCYTDWESYVRYLKYFLVNRLNYLNDLWGVEGYDFEVPESTGEYHDVYFKMTDGTIIEKRRVMDGTCIDELPVLDEEAYRGWYFWHLKDIYSNLRPVYEDIVLYAKPVSG